MGGWLKSDFSVSLCPFFQRFEIKMDTKLDKKNYLHPRNPVSNFDLAEEKSERYGAGGLADKPQQVKGRGRGTRLINSYTTNKEDQ